MTTVCHSDDNPMGYAPHEIDRQYNARASVPDCLPFLQEYADFSALAREQVPGHLGVHYGSGQDETLDIFPAAHPHGPVYVFLHGGYWRALSKDDASFMAPAFTQAGATVVAVNYSLAPAVSLHTIVQQCRKALAWVYRHIGAYGGDPARIHVSGSSAGGHLGAMLLSPGWHDALGVPQTIVHSASLFSGLFDLRPLLHTHINAWMRLDAASAHELSPIFALPSSARACELLVAWGEHETDEFKRQSRDYLHAWTARGLTGAAIEAPGANHFNVLMALRQPHTAITQRIFRMMGLPAKTG